MPSIKRTQGAYLPHWRKEGATYFVTFRLAGSLPSSLRQENEWMKKDILATAKSMRRPLTIWELDALEDLHFRDMDLHVHDLGNCFLKDDRIAEIVSGSLTHFQNERYILHAWCIMPNHVHAVVQPLGPWTLSSILHSWKRFSARKANQLLGESGAFWQEEYYDHLIRNEDDLKRCIDYTWLNPEKAGYHYWKWRGRISEERASVVLP